MKRGDIITDPDGRELRFSGYRGDRVKFYGGIFIPREEVEGWNEESMDDGPGTDTGDGVPGDDTGQLGTAGTDTPVETGDGEGNRGWSAPDYYGADSADVEDGK